MKNQEIKYNEVTKINTIKEILEIAVKEDGDKHAFEFKNAKNEVVGITYKEFLNMTNHLGTALSTIEMTDKHVAVIGENSFDWITVYLTVLQSNGVIVPIDKELTCDEIINVLNSSDSEVLFYSGKYAEYIEKIKEKAPNVKYFIGFQNEKDEGNVLSYKNFLEKGKIEYEKGNKTFSDIKHTDADTYQLKLLVYTSGTTDRPKGVMLTEHNLVSSVYYALRVTTVYTKCLSVLPYHHTYEAVCGLLVALHKHVTICINDSLKNVLKNLQLYKPDYIFLVPAFAEVFYKNIWNNAKKTGKEKGLKFLIVLSNLLRKIGIDKRKVFFKSIHEAFGGNLRKIVVGGAPLRAELGDFFDSIGIMLTNGYGITECSPLVSVNTETLNDPMTVGIVLPCCEIKFENVTPDGDGEICVKGDVVMSGYYKDKERTERVLKDGWFNTEDYGRFNEKHQLIINGRKKNIIVLDNGKNVYPEEIENYILGIPYVTEVVVKGIKNDIGQEVGLCAEVFPNKDKIKELGITDIEEALKLDISKITKDLPTYKKISEVEVRETEFNKTTTNKIKR
ncbi:MAG: AMP-binding protein [Clostridia bacterium]|nr:AMP-binding protein [Clostridia bacterium]